MTVGAKLDGIQVGQNATAANNFVITQGNDGTFKIARGNDGATTQDVLTVDASGNITAVANVNAQTVQQGGVAMGRMVLSTAQATTSGTSIDFTGIPSWVKRITVMFNSVSKSGTADTLVQIGTGGTPTATGYVSTSGGVDYTGGFGIRDATASYGISGLVTICHMGGNLWAASGYVRVTAATERGVNGRVQLSGTLDTVRLTSNGTDTFDGGSVNIMYEG